MAATPRSPRETPKPLNANVSAQMQRMPRRDSSPEIRLRRLLHHAGLRYRVQAKLPGRPDIAFTRAKIAVFVDGCFWHRCPEHATTPKNNREWWETKLARNVERDREKDDALKELGWVPVHVWEHEDPVEAANLIVALWRNRVGRAADGRMSPGCGILEDDISNDDMNRE